MCKNKRFMLILSCRNFSLKILKRRILKLVNLWTEIKLPRRFSGVSLPRQFNSSFQTMSNESKTQTTNFKENNCLENKSEHEHEENVLWKSKTAEEWYKFPKVQDYYD